jgi:glycosyltransferase involved in cell wall biosynthesis
MNLTIAICTNDREVDLFNCLEALNNLKKVNFCEIIVVDNSSKKNSCYNVILKFQNLNIKYFYSKYKNLSNSRNIALKNSSTDFIAYIDDDALIDENYYINFHEIKKNKIYDIYAGKIIPKFLQEKPVWLNKNFFNYLSITSLGDRERILKKNEYGFGTNIIFKRNKLLDIGGFETTFGRRGDLLISNDEIQIQEKMIDTGSQVFYSPKILVHHVIHNDRLVPGFFRSRDSWQYISDLLKSPSNLDKEITKDELLFYLNKLYKNSFKDFFTASKGNNLNDEIKFRRILLHYMLSEHRHKYNFNFTKFDDEKNLLLSKNNNFLRRDVVFLVNCLNTITQSKIYNLFFKCAVKIKKIF